MAIKIIVSILGGISCAITWWLIDRYIFGDFYDGHYYLGVVGAYILGARPWAA